MARRSLRRLSRQRIDKEDLQRVADEVRSMNDRPAAMVAATLVEDALEDAILSRMRKLTKAEYRDLFFVDSPLATFSSKIRVASALKVVYRSWARQIVLVKEIRNVFAHARTHIDFATPEIMEHTKHITVIDEHLEYDISKILGTDKNPLNQIAYSTRLHDPRSRYLGSCLYLSYAVWHIRPDPDDLEEDEDE